MRQRWREGKRGRELLKETERERERGKERRGDRLEDGGGGLYHPVTLCSPGHTAPGLLYPPLAINHLILSLLNRQPAPPHPN